MIEKIKYVKDLPLEIDNGTIFNIENQDVSYLTHGFHKYPGKFIPQIPKWAIEKYAKKEETKIIDPFCGSGTTLVEGLINGYDSVGVDIDPLSCLITKVKSTPIQPEILEEMISCVIKNSKIEDEVFQPKTHNIDHWFTEKAQRDLGRIRTSIDKVLVKFETIEDVEDYYDCLIVLFSSIIRRVSNADNQSQKTYVSGTKEKIPAEVDTLFKKQSQYYLQKIDELYDIWDGKTKAKVIQSNGSPNIGELVNSEFDLVITSPPYIKSIDYVYNQMAELFWVGDLFELDTQEKQNKKRRNYTGTTLIYKKEYGDFDISDIEIECIKGVIEEIFKDEKNGQKHAYIVNDYFNFMKKHLESMFDLLKENGHYIMVIGNSTVSDILVESADLIVRIAELVGYELENRWSYEIKNHFMGFHRLGRGGKIKEDHVLIFRKPNEG